MSEDKITLPELRQMFGEDMPVEAWNLLFDGPGDMTVGELRAAVRKIAERRNRPVLKPGDKIAMVATVIGPDLLAGYFNARTKLGAIISVPYEEIDSVVVEWTDDEIGALFSQVIKGRTDTNHIDFARALLAGKKL